MCSLHTLVAPLTKGYNPYGLARERTRRGANPSRCCPLPCARFLPAPYRIEGGFMGWLSDVLEKWPLLVLWGAAIYWYGTLRHWHYEKTQKYT